MFVAFTISKGRWIFFKLFSRDFGVYVKLYFKISLTFLPQTVLLSPPSASTRRHLVWIVAFAASPSTPSAGLQRAEDVHMDSGLTFYTRAPAVEVPSPKGVSSLPCLRHRKRTCLIQSDTQVKTVFDWNLPRNPSRQACLFSADVISVRQEFSFPHLPPLHHPPLSPPYVNL